MSKTAVYFGVGTGGKTLSAGPFSHAAGRKTHTVFLGAIKSVPYSKAGDPAAAAAGEEA